MSAQIINFPVPMARTPAVDREARLQDAIWSLVNYFGRGEGGGHVTTEDLILHLDGQGFPHDIANQAATEWGRW